SLLSNSNFTPDLLPLLTIFLQDLKERKLVDKIEEIKEALESNPVLFQYLKQVPQEHLTAAVNGCDGEKVGSLFRQL
ncbi:MAG: hypothetical protein D6769_03385, partial [Methanobacteriota archaeon]